ncbi:hypothetical protein IPG36_06345 [bacterium]|nr:MAG: hypothetical protein IPG36_06345 [bacterium]
MNIFKRRAMTYAEFWTWFAQHADEYSQLENDQDRLIGLLAKQFDKTDKYLCFLIGPLGEGAREFFVSCDGVRTYADRVREMVAAAPSIPGWKITAFKPPISTDSFTYDGHNMLVEDVYFTSERDNEHLDIVIYIPDYDDAAKERYAGLGFLILDSVVGEEATMNKIRYIEFAMLDEGSKAKLQPIRKLAEKI